MSQFAINLLPQPEFPKQDLTQENAALLGLLLQNGDFRRDFHQAAEHNFKLYSVAHLALITTSRRELDETVAKGINIGTTTYESIAAAVRPGSVDYPEQAILEQTGALSLYRHKNQIIDLFVNARDEFIEAQPRTVDVILEVTGRYNRSLGESAIAGAAVTRQMELQSLPAA